MWTNRPIPSQDETCATPNPRDGLAALAGFLLAGVGGWAAWHASTLTRPDDVSHWAYPGIGAFIVGVVLLGYAGRRYQRHDLRTGRLAALPTDPEPTADLTGRIPCPSCREAVIPGATVCPHCRQPIFARTPAKHAQVQLVILLAAVGGFWLLWQWMMP